MSELLPKRAINSFWNAAVDRVLRARSNQQPGYDHLNFRAADIIKAFKPTEAPSPERRFVVYFQ